MSSAHNFPDDPDSAGPWREVRGGLPAQDAHLVGLPEKGGQASAVGLPFHLDESDHWLGRIALYYEAHPTIPNLYHCCFDYIEPWDWSRETEHATTGRWIHLESPAND